MKITNLVHASAILLAIACVAHPSTVDAEPTKPLSPDKSRLVQPRFEVGQVWTYKNRAKDVGSEVTIFKIDETKSIGRIVHISISNVLLDLPAMKGKKVANTLAHTPISEPALRSSVVKLVRSNGTPAPNSMAGYAMWKEAFDAGKAGIFELPVAQIIDVLQSGAVKVDKTDAKK